MMAIAPCCSSPHAAMHSGRYLSVSGRQRHASVRLNAISTALLTGHTFFQMRQVVLLPISDGLVLTSFAPLLVALLSPLLLREVPSR